jgi:hypothetical protein
MNVQYTSLHQYNRSDLRSVRCTDAELDQMHKDCTDRWLDNDVDPTEMFNFILSRFDIDASTIGNDWAQFQTALSGAYEQELARFHNFVHLCEMHKRLRTGDSNEDIEESYEMIDLRVSLDRANNVIRDCYEMIMNCATARLHMNQNTSHVVRKVAPGRLRTMEFTDTNKSDWSASILWLLRMLERNRLRKDGDYLFYEKSVEGHRTLYWETSKDESMTIKNWIYRVCNPDDNYTLWERLHGTRDRTPEAAEYISRSFQLRCKQKIVNRHQTSWRDGIYRLEQDMFYPYNERHQWNQIADAVNASRKPFRDQLASDGKKSSLKDAVPPGDEESSIEFFDQEFGAWEYQNCHFMDIPTPFSDRVLKDQKLDKETMMWLYGMTARLWYELGSMENWQTALTIVGVAMNGKSFWQRMAKNYFLKYSTSLGGSPQQTFASESLHEAFLVCVAEMKRGLAQKFDTADLQSMLVGEEVSVNRKYKTAITKKWTANFFFTGNEYADWASTAGSMERRIFPFEWPHRVKPDPSLLDSALKNYGPFVRKANIAFHYLCTNYGHIGIATETRVLSAQMRQFHTKMHKTVNKFLAFLEDMRSEGKYEYGEDFYILLDTMRIHYLEYRAKHQLPRSTWEEDVYAATFSMKNLTYRLATESVDGVEVQSTFVYGIQEAS